MRLSSEKLAKSRNDASGYKLILIPEKKQSLPRLSRNILDRRQRTNMREGDAICFEDDDNPRLFEVLLLHTKRVTGLKIRFLVCPLV